MPKDNGVSSAITPKAGSRDAESNRSGSSNLQESSRRLRVAPGEDQKLSLRRNAFLVLNPCLNVFNPVSRLKVNVRRQPVTVVTRILVGGAGGNPER
jgi:hypothetical protein